MDKKQLHQRHFCWDQCLPTQPTEGWRVIKGGGRGMRTESNRERERKESLIGYLNRFIDKIIASTLWPNKDHSWLWKGSNSFPFQQTPQLSHLYLLYLFICGEETWKQHGMIKSESRVQNQAQAWMNYVTQYVKPPLLTSVFSAVYIHYFT